MSRFCGNCGRGLIEGDQFCPSCGRPAHETAQVSTPEANVPVPPLQMAGDGQAAMHGNAVTRHPFVAGCLGLVVLFVLFTIVVAAAIGASGGETANNSGGSGGGSEQAQSAEQADVEPVGDEEAVQVADEEPVREKPVKKEPPKEKPAPENKSYGLGESVKVGDITYRVTGAEEVTELSDPYGFDEPMTGNFVIVGFTFTNEGSDPATVSDIGMYLYDSQGNQYETDTDAAFYLPDDKSIFLLDRVNPGLSKKVKTVYSVPPDASGFELEVTSGFFATESERIKLGI